MLSSIHPLGERGRQSRFSVTASAFVFAGVVGGATTGLVFGALGGGLERVSLLDSSRDRVFVVAVVAGIALFFDLTGRTFPSVPRQVNEDWLGEFRGWVYGAGFGFQLGTGVMTFVTSAAVLIWLATMILVGSVPMAVVIGAVFGAIRGSSILFAGSIRTPEQLVDFHRRLHRSFPLVRRLSSVALISLTVTAAVLALGPQT